MGREPCPPVGAGEPAGIIVGETTAPVTRNHPRSRVALPLQGLQGAKSCTAQTDPSPRTVKPQATFVYSVLDMLM